MWPYCCTSKLNYNDLQPIGYYNNKGIFTCGRFVVEIFVTVQVEIHVHAAETTPFTWMEQIFSHRIICKKSATNENALV